MVVDNNTDKILGATLVGYETAELVRVLSLMEAGATWQLLEQSVHIHPTYGRHCQLGTAADWRGTCRKYVRRIHL